MSDELRLTVGLPMIIPVVHPRVREARRATGRIRANEPFDEDAYLDRLAAAALNFHAQENAR